MTTPRPKGRVIYGGLKVHWPKLDAFGNVSPACSHSGGFQVRPRISKERAELTCERCVGFANREVRK